jgi:SAM-dependent methyltransferase
MEKELYSKIYQIEKDHWWYAARRAIIFDWVFRLLEPYPPTRILDVGCGTGYNVEYMNANGYPDVHGLDMAPEALSFCLSRGLNKVVAGDLTDLPFANESYEMVTALDILEHLDDDGKGLRELLRILKPGGILILFVPAFQFLWSLQDEVSHHCRRYTVNELGRKIRYTGFEITKISYANSLLFPLVWVGRILLKFLRNRVSIISEADLSPDWSNKILERIFATERSLLRRVNFPVGVSILCVCLKPARSFIS